MNAARAMSTAAGSEKGFKDTDACVARAILQAPSRNAKQIETLKKLLLKYPEHLERLGISLSGVQEISIPEIVQTDEKAAPRPSTKEVVRLRPIETKYGPMVAIEFPYYPKILSIVKALKNRQFDAEGKLSGLAKVWLIPSRSEDVKIAFENLKNGQEKYPVEMDLFLKDILDKDAENYIESRSESADIAVPTKLDLRAFQRAGVKWAADHNGRCLIGDDMGLGKTPQALGYAAYQPDKVLPMLVLCPANVKPNWYLETAKFTDFTRLVISGSSSLNAFKKLGFNVSDKPAPGTQVTIVNYDLLSVEDMKTWFKMLLSQKLDDRLYAHKELVNCGRQVMAFLKEKMEKHKDIESRNSLSKIYAEIEKLGKEARSLRDPKHIRAFVNGVPAEEFIKLGGFKTIVADEIHYLQEASSQRSQCSHLISDLVENAIGLSGTPIMNKAKDIWSQIRFINKTIFPSFFNFGREFCNGHQKQAGRKLVWDFSGNSNLDKLDKILRSTIMIRRTQDQVLKELPPKTVVMIPFVLENKEEKQFKKESEAPLERLAALKKERDEWRSLMDSLSSEERQVYVSKHAEAAAKAGRLTNEIIKNIESVKQAAVRAKLDQAIKFIIDRHQQRGKVLVFCAHHETIDKISEVLRAEGFKVDTIDGRVTGPARVAVKDGFQDGDTDFLVCGIRAASEGLTLTAANTVVFCELDWNPSKHSQAAARVARYGQKNAVMIYYLIVLGTIEEKIAKMIDAKREVVNAVMGEGDRTLNEDGILDSILEEVVN